MPPGEEFVNRGEVFVGGDHGANGDRGAEGASGGRGGDGGFLVINGVNGREPEPDRDPEGMQGGVGGTLGQNGGDAPNGGPEQIGGGGGGGGGGSAVVLPAGNGGRGGNGAPGGSAGGDDGLDGLEETQTTDGAFVNEGRITIGGAGGDGDAGGEGGAGGGGGGGAGDLFLTRGIGGTGGSAGPGGFGGRFGAGGSGYIGVGGGGRFRNEGRLMVSGVKSGSGEVRIQRGGELHNTETGVVVVELGEPFTYAAFLIGAGGTMVNDGWVGRDDGPWTLDNFGTLRGEGVLECGLRSFGQVEPGSPVGFSTITGSYEEHGVLTIDLGGLGDVPPEYDYLEVDGSVALDPALSALELRFVADFDEGDLLEGDFFDVIRYRGSLSGEFSDIDESEAVLEDASWQIEYDVDLGSGVSAVRLLVPEPGVGALQYVALVVLAALRTSARREAQGPDRGQSSQHSRLFDGLPLLGHRRRTQL
jgi:hypothetical protein